MRRVVMGFVVMAFLGWAGLAAASTWLVVDRHGRVVEVVREGRHGYDRYDRHGRYLGQLEPGRDGRYTHLYPGLDVRLCQGSACGQYGDPAWGRRDDRDDWRRGDRHWDDDGRRHRDRDRGRGRGRDHGRYDDHGRGHK